MTKTLLPSRRYFRFHYLGTNAMKMRNFPPFFPEQRSNIKIPGLDPEAGVLSPSFSPALHVSVTTAKRKL